MVPLIGGPFEFDGVEVEVQPHTVMIRRDSQEFVTHYWWVDRYQDTPSGVKTRYHKYGEGNEATAG